ncbi:MAG: hypothetical protein KGN84_10040 [Acidobacteriota bacterium]|nr:hypothetical protein [Acidobacteriota bacterium]
MSCPEYKAEIIEAARSGDAARIRVHLGVCERCEALFEEQTALNEALHAIEEALPGGALETKLLKEFDSTWPVRRKSYRWLWAPAAIAAAALAALWLPPRRPDAVAKVPHAAAAPVPARVEQAAASPPRAKTPPRKTPPEPEPFIPIPYTAPIAPTERAQVMRVELPVAQLIAAGLPIATSDPGAEARADVLVGDDGRARAVRVISIFERSIDQ